MHTHNIHCAFAGGDTGTDKTGPYGPVLALTLLVLITPYTAFVLYVIIYGQKPEKTFPYSRQRPSKWRSPC